jgi:starch phosphorylase
VRVELFANGIGGAAPENIEMLRIRQLVGTTNGYAYRAEIGAHRPASDYTARLIPHHSGVKIPLEESRILWQR